MRETGRETGPETGPETGNGTKAAKTAGTGRLRRLLRRATSPSRGFILVLVVGALSVLTVLGLSYSEQSRADLLGASNGRDLLAADGLAETGFQMALRILADDRNVWSTSSAAGWNFAQDGVGHTSRWGYNTNFDLRVDADQDAGGPTPSGIQAAPLPGGQLMVTAYNHRKDFARNYIDSWQTMIWNEEPFNYNAGYAYPFKFDPQAPPPPPPPGGPPVYNPKKTYYNQRRPADERIMLDTWAYQPLARVKRFRIRTGLSYGVVQISIQPRDGAINVNDVFDVGTAHERWGFHDYLNFNGTIATDPLASPDRRTMEYILGRRPEYATRHAEYVSYDTAGAGTVPSRNPGSPWPGPQYAPNSIFDRKYQFVANEPAGSVFVDNGVYNFRGIAEPNGRTYVTPVGWPNKDPDPPFSPSSSCYGRLTNINTSEPLIFYNANYLTFYRYNFEAPRYPCYVAMQGPSMRYDGGSGNWLTRSGTGSFTDTAWWPTGRAWRTPLWSGNDIVQGGAGPTYGMAPDCLFQGFGFDLNNPVRGGVGVGAVSAPEFTTNDAGQAVYVGAGMYGHPVAHSFQRHFIAAVQQGRFWTDLEASWYFGGSPGYTNKLGRWPDEQSVDQWAYLGSSYDSLGIGTHWMPPTSHVWLPGFYLGNIWTAGQGTGAIDAYEASCGLLTNPRNMPPAKPAATYTHPLNKFGDDFGPGSPHFSYSAQRNMIRAFGVQENWGPNGSGNPDGRWFDAVNINVAPYEVVYGLLTPEKIPSMLNRTVVAPHLHWKARYFDGAYDKMETFARYSPTGDPLMPDIRFTPKSYPDTPYMPLTVSNKPSPITALPVDGLPPYSLFDPAQHPGVPAPYNAIILAPNELIPYRFGSVDFNGYFQEFKIDDGKAIPTPTTPSNIAVITIPDPSIVPAPSYSGPYPCNMGPAPYNFSIHRQYEPLTVPPYSDWTYGKQSTWIPLQTAIPSKYPVNYYAPIPGYKNNVGMILNKMDFRTPEPQKYKTVYQTNVKVANPAPDSTYSDPSKNPDDPKKYDYGLCDYKAGTGEAADDVFVDCHYDLSLAPNQTAAQHANPTSSMMCRPEYVTNWCDWFAQRKCEIDDCYRDPKYAPLPIGARNSNTVGDYPTDPYTYPEGRNFTAGDWTDGNKARLNPVAYPHPLYGVPNPDYMLLYPGTFPSYHWSDQFRRYFPVEGSPADFTAGVPGDPSANPPIADKPAGIGAVAVVKDPDVQDFSGYKKNPDGTFADKYSMAPAPYLKMVDDVANIRMRFIEPQMPTPKCDSAILKASFVPGISKDDAWRITRIGRKYQEIIADEIMDYQINPWWPNACAQFTEMAVPLDLRVCAGDDRQKSWIANPNKIIGFVKTNILYGANYMNDQTPTATGNKKTMNSIVWQSYNKYLGQGDIEQQVPDYYAHFNRFWIRAAHTYGRNAPTDFNGRYSDLRAGNQYGPINLVEERGKYPQTYQYWGEFYNSQFPLDALWQDNIRDFPENTLEDQLGSDFRYLTTAGRPMFETPASPGVNVGGSFPMLPCPAAQMAAAPGRNHPFKNWADFVAMLGHLVYRSPLTVVHPSKAWDSRDISLTTTRADRVRQGIRDRILGVNAYEVCHGKYADPRNQGQFFDGSKIALPNGPALADALQGYYGYDAGSDSLTTGAGGRTASEAIVAIDGFWPIGGNLGVFHDPTGKTSGGSPPEALLYPPRPGGMFTDSTGNSDPDFEWKRRVDEWRGCDAAGLRVEQQYISERAANDILVSLSNGQIGPIDFDGDGHITMTRSKELPTEGGGYWPLFPYNKGLVSGTSNVEYCDPGKVQGGPFGAGVFKTPSHNWIQAQKTEHITNCVTLPIKFRSNTFRVTVAVEMTDAKYHNTTGVHKYSRVYSRVIGDPAGSASKVHGPYTGEFILHGSRAIDGVDPENSWLGTDFGSE